MRTGGATAFPLGLATRGLIAGVLLALRTVVAQPPESSAVLKEYRQRVWTKDDGLPDNWVHSVVQSRNGYLWICTRFGLARFDGMKFTTIHHPILARDSAHLSLAEDSAGALWIGTPAGLLRYSDGSFSHFTTEDGLWDNYVFALHIGPSGDIWVGTKGGLNRVRQGQLERCVMDDWAPDDPKEVGSVFEDKSGRVWIGTETRLLIRDIATWEPLPILDSNDRVVSGSVFEDATGTVWLGSKGSLRQLKYGRWIERARFDDKIGGNIRWFFNDRSGGLWFNTGVSGVRRLSHGQLEHFDSRAGLPDDWVFCGHEDREGSLWFGTANGGLTCWQPRRLETYTMQDGLPTNQIRSVIESRDRSVWIGTDAGAAKLSRGTNWLVLTNYTTRHGLPIDTVRALWEDRKGRLWVGTELGLDCLEDGRFKSISVPGELFERAVRTIHEDHAGTIWFGSKWGLHRWRDGKRTTYTQADGLSTNEVRVIMESRNGELLVGTLGGGLNRLSFPHRDGETPSNPDLPSLHEPLGRSRREEAHFSSPESQVSAGVPPSAGGAGPRVTVCSTEHGLSNDMVTSLHEEPDGTLWIGTRHGLNRLRNGRIAALTTAHGLPDNWINSILDDDLGDLWFSSERGVFHARKKELHECADGLANSVPCVVYDESEGLLTRLTNGAKSQPPGWKCRDGTLWFATRKGVAVIDPKRAKLYETTPRVVIEQVKANRAIVYDNAGVGGSQSSAGASTSRAPIRLAPGSGDVLEFHYTAPTFIAPERARFRHRLEGFQTNWVDTGTERRAYYTNLRPGNYRFQVIVCNHNGIWSQTGASFAFYLTPHFYQIRWFQPFCWLLTGCFFGAIVFFLRRFHALQQAKERQEHALERAKVIEEERSRISRDLHEDLATGLTRIGLLSQQMTAAGASAPKVPEMIAYESTEMIGKLQELVWATNPKFDSLDSLVAHLRETTAGFLSESGLAVRLDFPRDIPAQPVSAILRREVALVLRETLNNIVKHASATEVGVQLRLVPKTPSSSDVPLGQLEVAVIDNGCGFDASKPTGSLPPFGGNGLSNMRHRMNSLGGDLSVESAPGQGTRVVARAPLCGHSGD